MNDRQILLSDLGVASLGDGEVFVAALGEAGIAGPIVGDDRRTRSNGALDKAAERFRAAVWHDSESDTSGVATALPLIELGSRLALSHFNGAGDKKLVVNAPALAARAAADPGFVDFDMVAGLAADAVLIRPNHTSAELVEDLKGGFVTGKPDLALELCGRHAGRLAGNQIGRPEPYAQRRMGALHDRPRRQPGVAAALSTAQDAGPAGEAERALPPSGNGGRRTRHPTAPSPGRRHRPRHPGKVVETREATAETKGLRAAEHPSPLRPPPEPLDAIPYI